MHILAVLKTPNTASPASLTRRYYIGLAVLEPVTRCYNPLSNIAAATLFPISLMQPQNQLKHDGCSSNFISWFWGCSSNFGNEVAGYLIKVVAISITVCTCSTRTWLFSCLFTTHFFLAIASWDVRTYWSHLKSPPFYNHLQWNEFRVKIIRACKDS